MATVCVPAWLAGLAIAAAAGAPVYRYFWNGCSRISGRSGDERGP